MLEIAPVWYEYRVSLTGVSYTFFLLGHPVEGAYEGLPEAPVIYLSKGGLHNKSEPKGGTGRDAPMWRGPPGGNFTSSFFLC